MKTRVLLADDHVILLEGLKRLLETLCDVVGTATDGRTLISLAEKVRPAVIVTDIYMPDLNGFDACEQLLKKVPESRVIFLTVSEDLDMAQEAIRRGAVGFLLKKAAPVELFRAIQTVAAGRVYITPAITHEPVNLFVSQATKSGARTKLSLRQREVLQLLAEGKSMKEAAHALHITARTIAFHKYAMMRQLGITRNSELVRFALKTNLGREREVR
jgi:DNA-binding NarL/FixJ family response regulator